MQNARLSPITVNIVNGVPELRPVLTSECSAKPITVDIVNGAPGLRPDLTSECSAKPHYSGHSEWDSRVTTRFDVRMLDYAPLQLT
jgi:hypothetical protein